MAVVWEGDGVSAGPLGILQEIIRVLQGESWCGRGLGQRCQLGGWGVSVGCPGCQGVATQPGMPWQCSAGARGWGWGWPRDTWWDYSRAQTMAIRESALHLASLRAQLPIAALIRAIQAITVSIPTSPCGVSAAVGRAGVARGPGSVSPSCAGTAWGPPEPPTHAWGSRHRALQAAEGTVSSPLSSHLVLVPVSSLCRAH